MVFSIHNFKNIGRQVGVSLSSPRMQHARAVNDRQSPTVRPCKDFPKKKTDSCALTRKRKVKFLAIFFLGITAVSPSILVRSLSPLIFL